MNALLKLDRRIVFLFLLVPVTLTVIWPDKFTFPIKTSTLVKGVHEAIEKLPPRAPILFALDFDPGSKPELEPMARAALRQCFRKDLRVISMTHWPTGLVMARDILNETVAEFDDLEVEISRTFDSAAEAGTWIATAPTPTADDGTPIRERVNVGRRQGTGRLAWRPELHDALRAAPVGLLPKPVPSSDGKRFEALRVLARKPTLEYGVHYCFLGTKAGEQILVLTMGESITTAFPTDARTGRSTRDLPVMEGVRSLKDVSYLLTIAAGASYEWWLIYGSQKHRFPMGIGCTAVMAPDIYPYYGARQITGLVGGIKGAWEYEALVQTPGSATKAVAPQTVAHCVLILLILICNVVYFASGRGKAQT